ncbi:hypothetical protein Lmac_0737 [Legionella maceachernii]|uniref:Uncharacterized protein n=2 Tax=Legionellaceae TaxID=444 RepID=A0A0W0WBQ9_9GAMM|nr:hypothetical protein Lmac_0737 [Legionella maceachernii]SJZ79456.1 hypothetical protein SAMN02745128_01095 [Legionella maceachernii]SUP02902.1 Uncharacterised protein [Legionella maceachernii]
MDPLGELEASLAYMFELQAKNTGGYIDPLVNKLRRALDHYQEKPSSNSLKALITALRNAFPVIEKYSVDSYKVRQNIEVIAQREGEAINWSSSKQTNRYPFFHPPATPKDTNTDLIPWLTSRIGKDFNNLDGVAQVKALISLKAEMEFRTKLRLHLYANPDFLVEIAMKSSQAFFKLMGSSLGHHLEKYQIAKAVYHHARTMIDESLEPVERAVQLFNSLNNKLYPLHQIEKLLEDPKAKAVLDKSELSELLQLYQSEEYREQQDYGAPAV